jgi:hypothetical protein
MSSDLIAFLKARLAEDAVLAAAASPGPWRVNAESDEVLAVDDITVAEGFALSGRQLRATTEHIARWHPLRVVAEAEAKRQAVDHYERIRAVTKDEEPYLLAEGAVRKQIQIMALPYANHPDYRQEWRP